LGSYGQTAIRFGGWPFYLPATESTQSKISPSAEPDSPCQKISPLKHISDKIMKADSINVASLHTAIKTDPLGSHSMLFPRFHA
jgi:hypothetical protein